MCPAPVLAPALHRCPALAFPRAIKAMPETKTVLLFLVTALAEIVGCYLPSLWLSHGKSAWLLVPGALSLDVCSLCHPFYTGKQKVLDTGGRVQKFADRFGMFGAKK